MSKKDKTPPNEPARWRVFADRRDGNGLAETGKGELSKLVRSESLVWVDILDPTPEDTGFLQKVFGFHALALSDLLNNEVRPKQESYEDVLFTVFRAINLNPGEEALDTINLNIFLTDRWVVTTHQKPLRTIHSIIERVEQDKTLLSRGTPFFFYTVLDGVVDRYLDILDTIEDQLDSLEERVFEETDESVQHGIFDLKKQVSRMRRLVGPEREALTSLVHTPCPLIDAETRTHLRDVLDHVLRCQDMLESYRDLLAGLMDSYMTKISNRMNEVMKMLSIIATIMLPLGFLTGLFGMNFESMPFLHWHYAFWGLVIVMSLLVLFMLWIFKRKHFL